LELVKALDENGWTKIYGPRNQYQTDDVLTWYGFRTYFGELPFDGVSVIREVNECGLCLVSPSVHQNRSEICSIQLFEAIAAGVPILCTPNPFIEWWFRDNVFVIRGDNVEQRTACVQQHMDYIVDNPMEVHEKMSNCRNIFNDYFSLDGQIDRFLQYIPPSGGGGVSIRPTSPPTPTRLPPSPPSI
jgi:glycosyltransferase involved in cell wall biosynthesis